MLILIERMFAGGFSAATTAIRAAAAPSVISGCNGVQTSATVCVTKEVSVLPGLSVRRRVK